MFNHNRLFSLLIAFIVAGCLFQPDRSGAAFFEKKFVIKKDLGKEVLCDAYVVQKNDYVTLLLKQRGDIAFRDFPRFLAIFKRLNPDVEDVNLIYPDQHLIIPLKIIAPHSVEGQASGTVTIPVITITNLPANLKKNSETYELKYGDWVSKLITQRFGPYNSEAYREAMKLFEKMNPDIADINLVRAGQKVRLPDPALLKKNRHLATVKAVEKAPVPLETKAQKALKTQPIPAVRTVPKALPVKPPVPPPVQPIEQASPRQLATPIPIPISAPVPKIKAAELLPLEPLDVKTEKKVAALVKIAPPPVVTPVAPAKPAPGFADKSIFEKTAKIMGARFLTKGEYFFPRSAASDFKLELSVMPVMEFDSGERILLAEKGWLTTDERNVIIASWKKARVLIVRPDLSLDETLNNVITAIGKNGYETMRSLTDGNISVNIRANYIFTPPGSQSQITCLSLLNQPEMKIDDAFRRYLEGQDIKVVDWIENPSFSGIAPAAANTGAYPDVDTVAAGDTPAFVHAVCTAMGWNYQNKVEVSFPYAGFQLKAVMDMISFAPGNDLLIDFGDLGGDAVVAIRDTGFNIVQLAPGTDAATFIDTLSGPGWVTVSKDPVFWAADRPKLYNPSFQVTGKLISENNAGDKRLLIVTEQVPDELALFLNHRGIHLLVTPG